MLSFKTSAKADAKFAALRAEGSKVLCALFLKTLILLCLRFTNVHCKTRQHRHLQLETTFSFFVNSLGEFDSFGWDF